MERLDSIVNVHLTLVWFLIFIHHLVTQREYEHCKIITSYVHYRSEWNTLHGMVHVRKVVWVKRTWADSPAGSQGKTIKMLWIPF